MEGALEAAAPPKKKRKPCARCGSFAKRQNVFGSRLCAECVEKSLHPAARGPMTSGALVSGAIGLATTIALPGLAVSAMPTVATFLFGLVAGASGLDNAAIGWIGGVIGLLLGPIVSGVVIRLAWDALRAEQRPFGTVVSEAMVGYGPLFATTFAVVLSIGLFSLLLIVPGVLRALDVMVATPITVIEEYGAGDSMSESAARMREHRGAIFGALTLVGLGVGSVLVAILLILGNVAIPIVALALPLVTIPLQLFSHAFAVVLYGRERLARGT